MNARQIVKFAANVATAIGAYGITRQVIDNNTEDPETTLQKVGQEAGSAAIAGLVADAASDRTDRLVDGIFDGFDKFKNRSNS